MMLTAWVALGVGIVVARQQNQKLTRQRDELVTSTQRLSVSSQKWLASATLPSIAEGVQTWLVNVPEAQKFELRFGVGEVYEQCVPANVQRVLVSPGQHRVTLFQRDSSQEGYRYIVYLDGQQVMEKTMGGPWMPNGWTSAGSLNWPSSFHSAPNLLPLASKNYQVKRVYSSQQPYYAQSDSYVTQPGYRLWIDQADRVHPPASPFMGFREEPSHLGIGLRDGIRYSPSSIPYVWTFTRPRFGATEALLRVEARFYKADGLALYGQSPSFRTWQIRNSATGTEPLQWEAQSDRTVQTAFLKAVSNVAGGLEPVIELQWDVDQPDAIAIRLADSPANQSVQSWSLRVLGGDEHLWRELRFGDRAWSNVSETIQDNRLSQGGFSKETKKIDVADWSGDHASEIRLEWQTNETLPLKIVQMGDQRYANRRLFQGIPTRFRLQLPSLSRPKLDVEIRESATSGPDAIPGGAIFETLEITFATNQPNWIRLTAEQRE